MWIDSPSGRFLPHLDDAALDADHRCVAARLADLRHALLQAAPVPEQRLFLHEALSNIRVNCAHEEELMRHGDFKGANDHRLAHVRLCERFEWLDRILVLGGAGAALEGLSRLHQDLYRHIDHEDRRLVEWHRQQQPVP